MGVQEVAEVSVGHLKYSGSFRSYGLYEVSRSLGQWKILEALANFFIYLKPLKNTRRALLQMTYTGEPISLYVIGKDARHNQVLISQNDHL